MDMKNPKLSLEKIGEKFGIQRISEGFCFAFRCIFPELALEPPWIEESSKTGRFRFN